jgi:hypothetical protein
MVLVLAPLLVAAVAGVLALSQPAEAANPGDPCQWGGVSYPQGSTITYGGVDGICQSDGFVGPYWLPVGNQGHPNTVPPWAFDNQDDPAPGFSPGAFTGDANGDMWQTTVDGEGNVYWEFAGYTGDWDWSNSGIPSSSDGGGGGGPGIDPLLD